jgi:hypothetical protein
VDASDGVFATAGSLDPGQRPIDFAKNTTHSFSRGGVGFNRTENQKVENYCVEFLQSMRKPREQLHESFTRERFKRNSEFGASAILRQLPDAT